MSEFAYLIEIREIYDGWSIGVTHDDQWVNRWPEGSIKHARTQTVIDHHNKETA